MQGIGYIIALFIFIIMGLLPLITIMLAKYITLFEKIVWVGIYIFGTLLLIKHSSSGGDFLLLTLTFFITFKISYARRKAIWLEKN